MREIKFRGVNIDTGSFVYGDLIKSERFGKSKEEMSKYFINETPLDTEDMYTYLSGGKRAYRTSFTHVIENSVGQYTCLKDKNGVEIYEGDLLRVPATSEYEEKTYNCFSVFYHDNECIGGQNIGFCINRMHTQGYSAGGVGYKFTPESISKNGLIVIGNIYENPELLKELDK